MKQKLTPKIAKEKNRRNANQEHPYPANQLAIYIEKGRLGS